MKLEFQIAGDKYVGYGTVRSAGCDIIVIKLKAGVMQPMYKAADAFIDQPVLGEWLPFEGLAYQGKYFNKFKYCRCDAQVYRFGTFEIQRVSRAVKQMDIPTSVEREWMECNAWLKAHGAIVQEL